MRYQSISSSTLVVFLSVAIPGVPLSAETCANCPADAVFCDDFDSYCDPAPTGGEVCEPSVTPDDVAFHAIWPADGACGPTSLEHFLTGLPDALGSYSSRAVQRGDTWTEETYDYVTRHVHDLTSDILNHTDNVQNYDAINGAGEISLPLTVGNLTPSSYVDSMDRNLRPQSLKGTFYFHPLDGCNEAAFANMVYYHELCLGDDRAPVNFTRTDCMNYHDCNCNGGGCGPGETPTCDGGPHDGMTCSNDLDCYGGPLRQVLQTSDGTVHASFAVGMMSIMDTNPCDLDQGYYPSVWRLVVFDGLTWHKFKAPLFDLPLTSPPDKADLYPQPGWNRVDFAIGEDDIEVRITNLRSVAMYSGDAVCQFGLCWGGPHHDWGCETDDDCPDGTAIIPNEYLVARVPRQYKGPFNKYALGPGKGRDLTDPQNPGSEECIEALSSDDVLSDEIVIYDGVFAPSIPEGACCLPGMLCTQATEADCIAAGGQWQGDGTDCATTLCCPYPWADADEDDDIDQADFGLFQKCYAGPIAVTPVDCECWDRDDNGHVDDADFALFLDCVTGPDIPFSISPPVNCIY